MAKGWRQIATTLSVQMPESDVKRSGIAESNTVGLNRGFHERGCRIFEELRSLFSLTMRTIYDILSLTVRT